MVSVQYWLPLSIVYIKFKFSQKSWIELNTCKRSQVFILYVGSHKILWISLTIYMYNLVTHVLQNQWISDCDLLFPCLPNFIGPTFSSSNPFDFPSLISPPPPPRGRVKLPPIICPCLHMPETSLPPPLKNSFPTASSGCFYQMTTELFWSFCR